MDIKHKMHKHPDNSEHKMQRLYSRINNVFVPVGWRCLVCGSMESD